MSHLSKIKTVLTEMKWLTAALKDLDCDFTEGGVYVRRGSEQIPVNLLVNASRKIPISGELGFAQVGDHIESVADWHGTDGFVNERFLNAVTQRYAYNVVVSQLEQQGFRLDEESVANQGREIHLVLRRSV